MFVDGCEARYLSPCTLSDSSLWTTQYNLTWPSWFALMWKIPWGSLMVLCSIDKHIPLSEGMGVEGVEANRKGFWLFSSAWILFSGPPYVAGGLQLRPSWSDRLSWMFTYNRNTGIVLLWFSEIPDIHDERPILSAFMALSTIQDLLAWEKFPVTLKQR